MKRLAAVMVSTALTMGLVTGCGSSGSQSGTAGSGSGAGSENAQRDHQRYSR